MAAEAQIYVLGTCALSTCALSICALSTCAFVGTINYKLLVHIFFTLCCHTSTFVESPLQINLALCKTKPIYRIPKMNVNKVLTRGYKNDNDFRPAKTNPNKPNSKPISEMLKMNVNSVKTRDYGNKRLCGLRENKPNSNPKQTQSNPTCSELVEPISKAKRKKALPLNRRAAMKKRIKNVKFME